MSESKIAPVKVKKKERNYEGVLAFYGLCVGILSAIALFNPNRTSDGQKLFVAGNAMLAGGYLFYQFGLKKLSKKKGK
jgi:hypothetical protein